MSDQKSIFLRSDKLSDFKNFSGRRAISKKTGKIECTNPEKTLSDFKENREKLSDFKKNWKKCDQNWNRDNQKWANCVQTKEIRKKTVSLATWHLL